MEILMVTGLLAYIMNYIIGKNKNSRLAQSWFSSHRELLESNFALVGECIRCYRYSTALFFNKKKIQHVLGDTHYEADLVLIVNNFYV